MKFRFFSETLLPFNLEPVIRRLSPLVAVITAERIRGKLSEANLRLFFVLHDASNLNNVISSFTTRAFSRKFKRKLFLETSRSYLLHVFRETFKLIRWNFVFYLINPRAKRSAEASRMKIKVNDWENQKLEKLNKFWLRLNFLRSQIDWEICLRAK